MNALQSIGSRPYTPSGSGNALTPSDSRGARAGAAKDATAAKDVSLSPGGLDLQQRIGQLGNSTVDLAQNLIGGFAQALLGDQAKGASISFDSVQLEASASFAAGAVQARGSQGVASAFAFDFSENSHFLGKGTITTADGRKLDFEVEIQYEARTIAAAGASSVPARRQELADRNPAMPLPEVEFPDIDFPGSLADLFRLMDRTISASVDQKGEGQDDPLGQLTMRLLKLIDTESPLAGYQPPGAGDKARSLANAYGLQQTAPGQAAELAQAARAAREAAAESAPPEAPEAPQPEAPVTTQPVEPPAA